MASELFKEFQRHMVSNAFRPDKRMGQNFLIETEAVDALIEAADLKKTDTVIEIGAGMGFITREITPHVKQVISYELDDVLFEFLKKNYPNSTYPSIEFRHENAFEAKWPNVNKIVSAPPYHHSSTLIEQLYHHSCTGGSLLLQQEFVSKLVSEPGFRDYTYISVLGQVAFDLQVDTIVPRNSFFPVPQTDSIILALRNRFPNGKPSDLNQFQELLAELFRYKNKDLSKAFSHGSKHIEKFLGKKANEKALKLDEELLNQKVFQLSPTDFLKIFEEIK
jgi:16S rRNA (adenine1518-N6/adenine1519-N6)-dimethyltransferase